MSCCCEQKQESDLTLLDGVLDEYASVPGSLITILQKAQEVYGYLRRMCCVILRSRRA